MSIDIKVDMDEALISLKQATDMIKKYQEHVIKVLVRDWFEPLLKESITREILRSRL